MPRDEVDPRPREAPGRGFEGWASGAPGGEQPGVAAALGWGCRRLWTVPGLWLLGWAGAAAAAHLLSPAVGPSVDLVGSLELALAWGAVVLAGLDLAPGLAAAVTQPLWALAQLVVVDVVLAGAAIVFLHGPAPVPFGERFGWACGTYAGRLGRLLALGAVVVVGARQLAPVSPSGDGAPASLPGGAAVTTSVLGLTLLVLVLALLLDLARVRMVVVGERSSIGGVARAARLLGRHPVRLPALYAVMAGLTVLMAWGAAGPASAIGRFLGRELGLGTGVALEVGRFLRVGVRLWTWAALIALYRGLELERLAAASLDRSATS